MGGLYNWPWENFVLGRTLQMQVIGLNLADGRSHDPKPTWAEGQHGSEDSALDRDRSPWFFSQLCCVTLGKSVLHSHPLSI